jgi:hypothetical protein
VSGNPRWKGMAWGMLPCLGSAMCACTWHLFYNSEDLQVRYCLFHMRSSCQCIVPHGVCLQSCSRAGRAKTFELRVVCAVVGADVCCLCRLNFTPSPSLQFLVALQAGLTVVGNFTCWWAAYRIYQGAQPQQG